MGRDKALLEVDGRALARIAYEALDGAGASEILAVGGAAGALEHLGFRWVGDRWPGAGPLGGVITALTEAQHDVVVVLACDLPDIAAATVRSVLAHLGDADAAVPDADGRRQVLVAAYRRRCLEPFEAAWEAGERALRHAVGGLAVAAVPLTDPGWVRNVNRPHDLEVGQRAGSFESEADERAGDE